MNAVVFVGLKLSIRPSYTLAVFIYLYIFPVRIKERKRRRPDDSLLHRISGESSVRDLLMDLILSLLLMVNLQSLMIVKSYIELRSYHTLAMLSFTMCAVIWSLEKTRSCLAFVWTWIFSYRWEVWRLCLFLKWQIVTMKIILSNWALQLIFFWSFVTLFLFTVYVVSINPS